MATRKTSRLRSLRPDDVVSTLIVAGTHGGQVFARARGADEWRLIADGLAPVNCIAV